MIDYPGLILGSTVVTAGLIGAMAPAQSAYPPLIVPYRVQEIQKTHSDVMEALVMLPFTERSFRTNLSNIYNLLAKSQEYLGGEFASAIFSDLEGLYEI